MRSFREHECAPPKRKSFLHWVFRRSTPEKFDFSELCSASERWYSNRCVSRVRKISLTQVITVKLDCPIPRNSRTTVFSLKRRGNRVLKMKLFDTETYQWNLSQSNRVTYAQGTRQATRRGGAGGGGFCPHFSRDSKWDNCHYSKLCHSRFSLRYSWWLLFYHLTNT